jgi:hypothetical protein
MSVVLITDRIYKKTARYVQKIRLLINKETPVQIAWIDSSSNVPNIAPIEGANVIRGNLAAITAWVKHQIDCGKSEVHLLALNQSALLPALAVKRLLGRIEGQATLNACDKRRARKFTSLALPENAVSYCEAMPGHANSATNYFLARRYVVKPAFGASSSDVKIFESWSSATNYAEGLLHSKSYVADDVAEVETLGGLVEQCKVIKDSKPPFIEPLA